MALIGVPMSNGQTVFQEGGTGPFLDAQGQPLTWNGTQFVPSAAPAPPAAPAGQGTAVQNDAFAQIKALLNTYGLPASLADRLWNDLVIPGKLSEAEIDLFLRGTPEFKQAFPEIEQRQAQIIAGKPLAPLSPTDIIGLRAQYASIARNAGLPSQFFDDRNDFTQLIVGDVSPNEFARRVDNGFTRVRMAAPEIRGAFNDLFGPGTGDQALAAWFIDPTKTEPMLMRQVEEAVIAGTGRQFGFNLGLTAAERLAQAGVGEAEARQGFGQIAQQSALFGETVTERENLTAEETGVGAQFGLSAEDAAKLRRRRQERGAAFAGSSQYATSEKGIIGAGTART
jgi:hypothetical protein